MHTLLVVTQAMGKLLAKAPEEVENITAGDSPGVSAWNGILALRSFCWAGHLVRTSTTVALPNQVWLLLFAGMHAAMVEDTLGSLFVRNEGGLQAWGQQLLDLVPLDALQEQVCR